MVLEALAPDRDLAAVVGHPPVGMGPSGSGIDRDQRITPGNDTSAAHRTNQASLDATNKTQSPSASWRPPPPAEPFFSKTRSTRGSKTGPRRRQIPA